MRTLDAGADKPLPALPMPPEANPFLGVRGIRLGLMRTDVLETQFRAILRVAAEHPVKAMLPMVATLGEIYAARAVLEQARADTGIDAPLEFGIMVEVPAAALTAARLAEHVDFFSLGTNDLTQYTMAAERGDERLAPLLTGPQPAVLRLVRATVRGGGGTRPLGWGVRRARRRSGGRAPARRPGRDRAEHGAGAGPGGQGGAARGRPRAGRARRAAGTARRQRARPPAALGPVAVR